ncbi:MAG TPA: polyribonucleotide nucleotidyltransferase, partial [Kiloniellaceae bacterium]|nr:polyribonucleotide nucleotidyltransferase [Kiloniellaceae bacterium]
MFDIYKHEIEWGGRKLTLETGRIARQANGAVLATYGETVVLCTAVGEAAPRPGMDFFPLTVNYQEKTFAAGKIPGGFFKREGRPSEKETLVSRLIDRPIRPLFAKGYKNETQVICTVLSHDMENDPDIVAMVGASAALTISGLPFLGPIGAARVGYKDGQYILNPLMDEMADSQLDLVLAGTRDGVLMVESEAQELTEEVMLGAVAFGHDQMAPVIDAIIALAERCAKEPRDVPPPAPEVAAVKEKLLSGGILDKFTQAYGEVDKQARQAKVAAVRQAAVADFSDEEKAIAGDLFKSLEADVVRGNILKGTRRIDGRTTKDIRPILAEVGVLPLTHGSALFTRGETQALVTTTLGTGQDEQLIDSLEGSYREHFMLHYNFPPYSVGECSFRLAPGRREIGHGKLAWRAVRPLLPAKEDFPYTIRVVSEITESNGSSSMATVCGTSLALMDAGVPLKAPTAGIAMGLILEDKRYAVLSDILGDEDHLGDMDFKICGTKAGVTAVQMDIKIQGLTRAILEQALQQAQRGRFHILGKMAEALPAPREELNKYAPRIFTINVKPDKIRDIIGPGGKTIRGITAQTGVAIDVEDDGTVHIASPDGMLAQKAIDIIKGLTAEAEVGEYYMGLVKRLADFGAFVEILPGTDGLVHISE